MVNYFWLNKASGVFECVTVLEYVTRLDEARNEFARVCYEERGSRIYVLVGNGAEQRAVGYQERAIMEGG